MFIKMEAQAGDDIEYVADLMVSYNKTLPNFIYPLCNYNGVELIAWDSYSVEDIVEHYNRMRFE